MNEYFKKVDKSFFNYGITIPRDYVDIFLCGEPIVLGTSREISISFKNNKYDSRLNHVNRRGASDVYQIRWDKNYELLSDVRKEFIQSYFAIINQNFHAKKENKYFVTNLLGGNQEVVVFRPVNKQEINLETFIKIETPYDEIFKALVDQNVFGWLSEVKEDHLIYKSTKWLSISELYQHEDIGFVVYYLLDEMNKELYIGSARRLGDRVKPGRSEIPGWNMFRYEILHPLFHKNLREVEYHSIMNFARMMKNDGNLTSVALSDYRLVNKDYKFYQK